MAPMVGLTVLLVRHSWKMALQSSHLWNCCTNQMVLTGHRNQKKELQEQRNQKKELPHCLFFHHLELHN
jgi:hypothetical protein